MAQRSQQARHVSQQLRKPRIRKVNIGFAQSDFASEVPQELPVRFYLNHPIRKIVEPTYIQHLRGLIFGLRNESRHYRWTETPNGQSPPTPAEDPIGHNLRRHHQEQGCKILNGTIVDPFRDIYFLPPPPDPNVLQYPDGQQKASNSPPAAPAAVQYRQRFPSPSTTQQPKTKFSSTSTYPAPSSSPSPAPINNDQYHRLADIYIENLVLKLEALQEEKDGVDCEYSAGVLTLTFPPLGTYVINKQPPNKQIWLSSPKSGPKKYDYVAFDPPETEESSAGGDGASRGGAGVKEGQGKRGGWVYLKDGSSLSELLDAELGLDLGGEEVA
ncbi:MAG: hypothetical protein Q9219_001354 [cf. Caloplaca sp. 3 TL-2023]